ncbi:CFS1-like protein [Mycena sanguinolenta]|uniref:CFS1-like protein n=1 Tax=Mycena sanguinolenta TaxID=230812 RepID=A0A8H7D1I3_9AGAR|nr:CFS1-like protein [Mycena sanguinolenta]
MALYSSQLLKTPTTHSQYSFFRLLDTSWCIFTETAISTGLRAIHPIRSHILSVLSKITRGKITLITESETLDFGEADAQLHATLRVKRDAFWMRVALFTDLGLAEAFMFGDVDCEDISSLIQILIANRRELTTDTILASLLSKGRSLTSRRFLGSLVNSKANISAHYDLGNTMFSAYLSQDMNYSSAIFEDYNEDLDPATAARESLEDAQLRKVRFILKKAKIGSGQRVLEIGTGWGSLAILAAKTFNCTVETVTLSSNQAALARKRIEEANLTDKITVHCMDFRECKSKPEWAASFDAFISVEMIEHVGKNFFNDYWAVADWALKPDTGIGVVQGITIPEARVASYDVSADFVQKWVSATYLFFAIADKRQVFPGGYLPSFSFWVQTLNESSKGRLVVDSVVNIGPHYARTLREWKRRFIANWEGIVAKALVQEYNLDAQGLEIFRRKWIYYFDYCEAAFKTRTLGDHIVTFTREGHIAFGCDAEV